MRVTSPLGAGFKSQPTYKIVEFKEQRFKNQTQKPYVILMGVSKLNMFVNRITLFNYLPTD